MKSSSCRPASAMRESGRTPEVALRDDLDDIPLRVRVERLLDVWRVESIEHRLEIVAGLDGERNDVAVGRAIELPAQVGPQPLDGRLAAEGPLIEQMPPTDDLSDEQIAEVLRQR